MHPLHLGQEAGPIGKRERSLLRHRYQNNKCGRNRMRERREIGEWEAGHPSGQGWSYYECWLLSLERLVSGTGLVTADDLRARLDQLAARPAGHDHGANHRHDHGE